MSKVTVVQVVDKWNSAFAFFPKKINGNSIWLKRFYYRYVMSQLSVPRLHYGKYTTHPVLEFIDYAENLFDIMVDKFDRQSVK